MEKKQNIPKKEKILEFLKKYNPYRKILRNEETNEILDPKWFVYYQKLIRWLIDICLNSLFIWYPLFAFKILPLHWIPITATGIASWYIIEIVKQAWRGYVDGKKEIERAKPSSDINIRR